MSSRMRIAVYAGSFDPPTNGHLWMIQQALELFDHVYVAIGDNPSKSYTFTRDQRMEFLQDAIPSCERLTVSNFDNRYLVNYAKSVNATHIIRGIRSPQDYEYERVMRNINGDMAPDIQTVFLMPPRDIADLSSSMVKGLVGPNNWEDVVRRYVPTNVFAALEALSDDN